MTTPSEPVVDEIPIPPAKSRWLLPCGCLVVLGLVILLPAFALFIASTQSARRVEQLLAGLRKKGEPTTPAELEAMYRQPRDKVDTTALWTDAFAILQAGRFQEVANPLPIVGTNATEIPAPGETWDQLEAAAKLLEQFQPALDKMHLAGSVENGTAHFDLRFEDGFNIRLDQIQEFRTAARVLSLEAHVHAHRGNADGVFQCLKSILATSDALENEPILVSQLVRIALVGIGTSDLCKFLPNCDFTDAQLDDLSKRFAKCERPELLTTAFFGERVLGMDAIRNPGKVQLPGVSMPRLPFQNDNLVFYLEFLDQTVEATRKPYPEALDAVENISNQLRTKIGGGGIQKVRYMVAAMLVPAFDASFNAAARDIANCRMAQVVIACEKFQRRNGRLPNDLDELVPEFLPAIPSDPSDGQPLRYIASEQECKVYSVGRNRKDDRGDTTSNGDDVLTLKRRNM